MNERTRAFSRGSPPRRFVREQDEGKKKRKTENFTRTDAVFVHLLDEISLGQQRRRGCAALHRSWRVGGRVRMRMRICRREHTKVPMRGKKHVFPTTRREEKKK